MRLLLVTLLVAFAISASTARHATDVVRINNNPLLGAYNLNSRRHPVKKNHLMDMEGGVVTKVKRALDVVARGGAVLNSLASSPPPRRFLAAAYSACGLATTAAWTAIVITTIRSNQPVGQLMPTFQHGLFARIGALSAVPLIGSTFATLASSASKADSWDELSTPTCRRLNLGLVVAGVGSALWTRFAPLLTKIPGTNPLLSHQAYQGAMRTGLISCYASAAVMGAAIWVRSLPSDVRKSPFSWPGRIADGVSKSLVSLGPANCDNPVNVKYSLLFSSFLIFTGLQLGSHPLSVIPSWTGRRLARAFPAWTILGAIASYNLKEAVENDNLEKYKILSNGLRGFGITYLAARIGAVFFDPSFPDSYHAVVMVPGWACAAILMVGLTLRSDKQQTIAKCETLTYCIPESSNDDEGSVTPNTDVSPISNGDEHEPLVPTNAL